MRSPEQKFNLDLPDSTDHSNFSLLAIGSYGPLNRREILKYFELIKEGKRAAAKLYNLNNPSSLTEEEIKNLEAKQRNGNQAREEVILHNGRLVIDVASKYLGRGLNLESLTQEGIIGLMKAIDEFDHKKGYQFSTYAVWWIRQAITRAIENQARTIRIPSHAVRTLSKVLHEQEVLKQKLGRKPTAEEIGREVNLKTKAVMSLLQISQPTISTEMPIGDSDELLESLLPDKDASSPEIEAIKTCQREEIEKQLKCLTAREEKVLSLHYGLNGFLEHSLNEIGQKWGLTRERIRQIEEVALKKLKKRLERSLRQSGS